jgi:hypothetical protein
MFGRVCLLEIDLATALTIIGFTQLTTTKIHK